VLACLAFGGVTVIGVLIAGPPVMRLLFGSEFDYDRLGMAYVAAGMGLYLSATTVNQAVLAQGRARLAAASWATSAVFFVVFLLVAGMEEVREVEVAFLATAGILSVLLYLAYRTAPDPQRRIRPGSTEESEVILAAMDEAT
jgi:O-antigen/teichoic acid export membrane protein